jgi:hypothetical protein
MFSQCLLYGVLLFQIIVNEASKTDDVDYVPCDPNIDITGFGIDYTGSSSKFDYYNCDDTDYRISQSIIELSEWSVNSDDGTLDKRTTNKIVSFAGGSQEWHWNTTEYSDDNNYLCNTYQSILDDYLMFNFHSCLVLTTVNPECAQDEECDPYTEGSVKWSFEMGQWNWANRSDKLVLIVELQSSDKDDEFESNGVTSGEYSASLGDIQLRAPTEATLKTDDGDGALNVNVNCENTNDNDENRITCTFIFDYYIGVNQLEYDPILSFTSNAYYYYVNNYLILFFIIFYVFISL